MNSRPLRHFAALVCSLPLAVCAAADAPPVISEPFNGPELPGAWQAGGRPGSFKIVDAALQGTCSATDSHGPSIGVPISARDVKVTFRMRMEKTGHLLCLVDGDSAFGGQAHLLRCGLSPDVATLAQDRGDPRSKLEQKKQRDAAAKSGQKMPPPTKEQLADPAFYRVERLGLTKASLDDGQWHGVSIELRGNSVTAVIDGKTTMTGNGTVLDVPKSRFVLLVGQAGVLQVDDVKVWALTK